MTDTKNYEKLRTLLMDQPELLTDVVIDALAAAGAEPEWDSGTIENVLSPFKDVLDLLRVPWVGNTGSDDEALHYWQDIADVRNIDYTPAEDVWVPWAP